MCLNHPIAKKVEEVSELISVLQANGNDKENKGKIYPH